MKKILGIGSIIILLILVIRSFVVYSRYEAFFEGDNYDRNKIVYGDESYVKWDLVEDDYYKSGVIHGQDMYPYSLISDNLREKIYVCNKKNSFIANLLPPYSYFSFCEEGDDFIRESPDDTSLDVLYVKEGFVFPNINENEVNEIWTYLDPDAGQDTKITDEEKVRQIVDCAKNMGEKELDKDIYDFIVEKSWKKDYCYFFLKYTGYPLVEEFYVDMIEDGRYVVKQKYDNPWPT